MGGFSSEYFVGFSVSLQAGETRNMKNKLQLSAELISKILPVQEREVPILGKIEIDPNNLVFGKDEVLLKIKKNSDFLDVRLTDFSIQDDKVWFKMEIINGPLMDRLFNRFGAFIVNIIGKDKVSYRNNNLGFNIKEFMPKWLDVAVTSIKVDNGAELGFE